MKKNCDFCGDNFAANRSYQRFCSKKCGRNHSYRTNHPWVERKPKKSKEEVAAYKTAWEKNDRIKNPEKYKAKTKRETARYRMARGVATSEAGNAIINCVTCGTEFESSQSSAKYCSKKCRWQSDSFRANAKKYYWKNRGSLVASSKKYYEEHKDLKGQPLVECVECGKLHTRQSNVARYCSASCLRVSRNKMQQRERDEIGDKYIANKLLGSGRHDTPPEILELKRAQIKLTRAIRKTKDKAKNK